MASPGVDVLSTIEFQISLFLFVALLGHFIVNHESFPTVSRGSLDSKPRLFRRLIFAACYISTRIGQSVVIGEIFVGIVASLLTTIATPFFIGRLFASNAYKAKA